MIIVHDRFQDYIQDKFDTTNLTMLNEFIFYGIFIYYYYFGPIQDSQQNFRILKYILLVFTLRYLLNYITKYTIIDESKKEISYSQFNGKIAVFTILVLFLSIKHENIYTTLAIVFSYALLSSAAKYGYTIDNLLTVGITFFIFSLNLI
jgi:hypothetical protein